MPASAPTARAPDSTTLCNWRQHWAHSRSPWRPIGAACPVCRRRRFVSQPRVDGSSWTLSTTLGQRLCLSCAVPGLGARFALPAKIQLAGWAATGSLAGAAIESPCGLWDTLGGLYTARRALAHVAPYPARLPPDPCLPSAVLLAPRRGHIVVYGESPRRPMCGIDALKLTSVAPGGTRRRRCPPRLYTRALHPCRPLAGQGVRAVITN